MRYKRNIIYLKSLLYEFKSIGFLSLIPILVLITIFFYCKSLIIKGEVPYKDIVPALEYVAAPFAAWWGIFVYMDILEAPGGEIIFSYPVKRYRMGILKAYLTFILYALLEGVMLWAIQRLCKEYFFDSLYLQFLLESFFLFSLGFFSMIILRSSSFSILVVASYCLFFIFLEIPQVQRLSLFFRNEVLLNKADIWDKLHIYLYISIAIGIIAQLLFKFREGSET